MSTVSQATTEKRAIPDRLGTPFKRILASWETLLFGVKGSDPGMLALPALVLFAAALLAALPAVLRAARIDPAIMLRAE